MRICALAVLVSALTLLLLLCPPVVPSSAALDALDASAAKDPEASIEDDGGVYTNEDDDRQSYPTPEVVEKLAETIRDAQDQYFKATLEKNGVGEYASTFAQLENAGCISPEIAKADATRKDRVAFNGYFLFIKTNGLFMNEWRNHHVWWKRGELKTIEPLKVDGRLTKGVGVLLRHKSTKVDPLTHSLAIGIADSSTGSKLLSLMIRIRNIDYFLYWITWMPTQ